MEPYTLLAAVALLIPRPNRSNNNIIKPRSSTRSAPCERSSLSIVHGNVYRYRLSECQHRRS